jgi:hypothetical protein
MIVALCVISLITTTLHAGVWPSGGTFATPLRQAAKLNITWDQSLHAKHVHVELWDGEQRLFIPIARDVAASDEQLEWTIPTTLRPGKLYRFVVRDADIPMRAEFSSGFHAIGSAANFATTVEDETSKTDSLYVSPFPAADRARVAWTHHDAASIDIIDLQGAVVLHIEPAQATRSCVVQTSALLTGTYTVALTLVNGSICRSWLVVSH